MAFRPRIVTCCDMPDQDQWACDTNTPVKGADPGSRVLTAKVVQQIARESKRKQRGRKGYTEQDIAALMPATPYMKWVAAIPPQSASASQPRRATEATIARADEEMVRSGLGL